MTTEPEFKQLTLSADCPWTGSAASLIFGEFLGNPNPAGQDIALLRSKGASYYGLCEPGRLLAVGSLFRYSSAAVMNLELLTVAEPNRGYGRRILNLLEMTARESGAEFMQVYSLVSSIGFYARQGYASGKSGSQLMSKKLIA